MGHGETSLQRPQGSGLQEEMGSQRLSLKCGEKAPRHLQGVGGGRLVLPYRDSFQ